MSEAMDCPKDLIEWANSDHMIVWYLYDVDLLPEQIRTKEQVCALRGFKFGWECRILAAEQSVQRIGLLARLKKWFGAIANR